MTLTPSRITKIYDHFLARLKAALPEHEELLNPDELDENPAGILKAGYGLILGDGENTDRCLENQAYYYRRNFTFMLTREVIALQADAKSRADKWKASLEDLHRVLKATTSENTIVDGTDVLSFKVDYARDSGPRSTIINGEQYVFIELTVTAEYREPTGG